MYQSKSKLENQEKTSNGLNMLRVKDQVVQRRMGFTNWAASAGPPALTPLPVNGPNRPHTDSSNRGNVVLNRIKRRTTPPVNLTGMDNWKNYNHPGTGENINLLRDPSKNDRQTLTRMHMIRGRFLGQSIPENMFLGTAYSNNFHTNSHYREVEKPIQDVINTGATVDYTVTPHFNNPPAYMWNRRNEVAAADRGNFINWINNACPSDFTCDATAYRMNGGAMEESTEQEIVRADVGAANDSNAATNAGITGVTGAGVTAALASGPIG